MIWLGNWDVPYPWIINEKPVRQVAFLVHDPNDGIEEGLPFGPGRPYTSRMRKDQCTGKQLMFGLGERFVPYHQSRREVDQENSW
jgi:hypothetical protein